MKVFISHKDADSHHATRVSNKLRVHGLQTYLDVIDAALGRDGPGLCNYIRSKMTECDQLIAVVSEQTKESWWVPWEIGVASEKDFLIATFALSRVEIPSYLKKWPYLQTDEDLDKYAAEVSRTRRVLVESSDRMRPVIVRDFHRKLKESLSQS